MPGDQEGIAAEWWIAVETPMGWYYYEESRIWHFSENGMESLVPAYQGALSTITEPWRYCAYQTFRSAPTDSISEWTPFRDGFMDLNTMVYDTSDLTVVATESGSYPVVDTAQITCYDDSGAISCPDPGEPFYGQDAQHTANAPSYTDNSDGTITDNITGLMWQQSPDTNGDGDIDADDKLTYDEAVASAGTLSLGGYTDWRLPTIKELYSLIDFRGTRSQRLRRHGYRGPRPLYGHRLF
jgi:hypothetical protein